MALLYKHFNPARTVFYAFLACFFIAQAASAQESDLFTVENVKVDVTAASAMAARDQAFAAAQVQAFEMLAARMLPETEMTAFKAPDLGVISPMIQDYEITQEKLSSVRYVGTYTFRFKDAAVRKYFAVTGIPFTDISSKPVLMLPFFEQGGRALIWSPYNAWMQAWNRSSTNTGLVPVVVPIGELEDVRDLSDDQALNYSPSGLRNMLTRYDAVEAVVAVAVPDENLAKLQSDQVTASGGLTIHVYRTDQGSPQLVQQIDVQPRSGQTRGSLFDDAVRKVHSALQSDWKTRTLVQPVPQQFSQNVIKARVIFNNMQEWAEIRKALSRVSAVSDMTLRSLSPKSAYIDLSYQGPLDRLTLALQQMDLMLTAPQIQPEMAAQGGYVQNTVYMLTRSSRAGTINAPTLGGMGAAPVPPRAAPYYTGQF
jgi:hypothetical protein